LWTFLVVVRVDATNNAQSEEYLTDVIYHLLQAGLCSERVFTLLPVAIDHPRQVMAFNTPAELCEIEAYYREKQRNAAA
jgi:bifunctional N-acetylglucosamine-1-phosphate-uridyltransferase/glucosamine-1-phosphate-acetyltransferase GlmU-like protein